MTDEPVSDFMKPILLSPDATAARAGFGFTGTDKLLGWGSYFLPSADSAVDKQFAVVQRQQQPGGVLGAIYGQKVSDYTGGSSGDADAPVNAAVHGYNQVGANVTYCNELGGLFVTDNYSYHGQGSGVFCQGNARHGGRAWGVLGEGKEWPELLTATAGQTQFDVPNHVPGKVVVLKNKVALQRGTDFTDSDGQKIVLSSPAAAGDEIRAYREDPAYAVMGAELDVYAGAGSDNANPISGNRIGLSIFAYRLFKDVVLPARVGTLLNLVSDPADGENVTVDRGVLFQGRFAAGIDFSATNAVFTDYLIKFRNGAGVSQAGNLAIGDAPPLDTPGHATVRVRNDTSGGLIEVGGGQTLGRVQASNGSGVVFGSDTDTDVLVTRKGLERLRVGAGAITASVPIRHPTYIRSTAPSPAIGAGAEIYVSDLTGGAELCFSDGVNWRRNSNREVMS